MRAKKLSVILTILSILFVVVHGTLNSPYSVYASNIFGEATISSSSELIDPYKYRYSSSVVTPEIELFAPQIVSVVTKDSSETIFTKFNSVSEILESLGIKYSKDDIIIPALDDQIAHTGKITVIFIEKKMDEESSSIDFDTKLVEDPNLELGKEKVVQEGVLGAFTSRYQLTYKDGELVDRKLVESFVSEQPQPKIVAKGTKIIKKNLTLPDGSKFTYCQTKQVKVTAYDPTCLGCNSTTALGYELKMGVIAVDPRVIPFYTRMYVPGYGVGLALDTGGAIKGNIIDVGFSSPKERGRNWGGTRLNHTIYLACPS